jgi:exopolysaccharide biosynthesis WecB/TagA/CpsF family protein
VISAAKADLELTVTALAVHGVMTGVLDPIQRWRLNEMDITTPDGQPVRWALFWLYGIWLPERVYGPTLMLRICEQAEQEGLPIYLFGSKPGVITDLKKNLQALFPNLIFSGIEPSRFRIISIEEKKETILRIKSSGAALVFVGLGCPRQEVWIFENREQLKMPLIAVGAAFDFHAGNLSQAPANMQKFGLEWLFRLVKEPTRLWRRYLTLNPLFVWYLILQKSGIRRFNPNRINQPVEEIRYG